MVVLNIHVIASYLDGVTSSQHWEAASVAVVPVTISPKRLTSIGRAMWGHAGFCKPRERGPLYFWVASRTATHFSVVVVSSGHVVAYATDCRYYYEKVQRHKLLCEALATSLTITDEGWKQTSPAYHSNCPRLLQTDWRHKQYLQIFISLMIIDLVEAVKRCFLQYLGLVEGRRKQEQRLEKQRFPRVRVLFSCEVSTSSRAPVFVGLLFLPPPSPVKLAFPTRSIPANYLKVHSRLMCESLLSYEKFFFLSEVWKGRLSVWKWGEREGRLSEESICFDPADGRTNRSNRRCWA